MIKIGLRDKEFEHIVLPTSYCGYEKPKYIEWDRENPLNNDIVVYTDRCLPELETSTAKIKVAWLLESMVIRPEAYEWARNGGIHHADYVISHTQSILDLCPEKSVFFPGGAAWLYENEQMIYAKSKNVSIIASAKDYAPGHCLRHRVIKELGSKIDSVYVYGYNPIEPKKLAFIPYRYSIVIENNDSPDYWTDKLLDAFLTGTIPIFWGGSWLHKYFDSRGYFTFNTVQELDSILTMIKDNGIIIYQNAMNYIIDNFERAKKFAVVEDHLWENLFKRLTND